MKRGLSIIVARRKMGLYMYLGFTSLGGCDVAVIV